MERISRKIKYYASRIAVAGFFCIGIFAQCASPMMPPGGPKDSLPPVVMNITPPYGTTNFDGKRIFIEFDEYIKLQDQSKEFFTSPFMKKKPILLVRGRGVQVDIQDTLVENTTYSLNFGSSIRDNNEGNALNSFRYVFSTGDIIDSMVMSGYTVDAYKKDTVAKTFILFYAAEKDSIPDYDSTLFNTAGADAVARAENNGIFVAENLKPIRYRIYALKDNNNNEIYDPGVDDVGFLDTIYNPADMPGFNVWYDTIRQYITANPQLLFRMFRDKQFKRQYLAGQSRPNQHKLVINFGAHEPEILELTLDSIDNSQIITEYLKPTRDSIALWLNVPAEMIPDTVRGRVIYMRHDSLNVLVPDTQRISQVWRLQESRQQQKEREEKEKARQAAIDAGEEPEKEPNPFVVRTEAANPLNPEKNIQFTFDYPLVRIDSANISLIRTKDDKKYRVRYQLYQDSSEIRKWTIRAPWMSGESYELLIPEGTFLNVAGQTNDTLQTSFTIMEPDRYSTLNFRVIGKTPESEYILQLLDQGGNTIIKEVQHAVSGTYTFQYINPGKVRLRVIEDMNGNGEWDPGDLIARIQPERVEIFSPGSTDNEIETKVGWDVDYEVDMNVLFGPITMERMQEEIRKLDEVMIQKYLENKAKREEQERMSPSRGSSSSFGGFGGLGGNQFQSSDTRFQP